MPLPPVLAFFGPDPFLRANALDDLRTALAAEHPAFETFRFDAATATTADVLDECRSFGLMAPHKLVILDNAEILLGSRKSSAATTDTTDDPDDPDTDPDADAAPNTAAARALFERYLAAPADNATLVFMSPGTSAVKLTKALADAHALVDCAPPTPDKAARWAAARAASHHAVTLDDRLALALVDRLGPDLGRIDTELAKLSVAAKAAGLSAISPALIDEQLGAVNRDDNVFHVIAPILLRDHPAHALAALRDLLDAHKKSVEVPATIAAVQLAAQLHALAQARAQRLDTAAVAKDYRLWGDARNAIFAALPRVSPAAARRLLADALAADAANKSGLGSPDRTLERLALRFSQVLAGSPR